MTRPLVYIVEVPTPYRNAELDRAAEQLGPERIRAIFLRPSADGCFAYDLPQRCEHRVLASTGQPPAVNAVQAMALLRAWNPHAVVLGGYQHPLIRQVLAWCRRERRPFCFRSDTNVFADRLKGWPRSLVRRVRLGPWIRHAHRILLTGRYNRDFWRRYGMLTDQEGWWPQWIDYDHFGQAAGLRAERQAELRHRFRLPGEVNVLHVGRLVRRKRVELLCQALESCNRRIGLAIAGSGPEEPSLRRRYEERLAGRLKFLGPVAQQQLPELYAAGDVLAVASGESEPWGMVLNEAAAAGLPIVCHERVGAAGDLLVNEGNGMALRDDSAAGWAAAIERLAANASLRHRMGEQSVQIAARWRARSEPAACLGPLLSEPAAYRV